MSDIKIDAQTSELLKTVAGSDEDLFKGAFNIRSNMGCLGRQSSQNIEIRDKADGKPGLEVHIKPYTKDEKVFIPACVTVAGVDDLVYNDFYVGEGADVVIVAGCGIHTETGEPARHNGIHRFFLEKDSKVVYEEKHIGTGAEDTKKIIDPVTEVFMEENSYLLMDTAQLGGVSASDRTTRAKLGKKATLVIKERLLTDNEETAKTFFEVEIDGEDAGVDLMSRSVAKGNSHQEYTSNIIGNKRCTGHSACDAIIAGHGKVDACPKLIANDGDAQLIHEAAIGKIAGEQILKLKTLGLTEEEAEAAIIKGFLK